MKGRNNNSVHRDIYVPKDKKIITELRKFKNKMEGQLVPDCINRHGRH